MTTAHPPPSVRRPSQFSPKHTAFLGSILLHGLVLIALFSSASGQLVSAAGGGGPTEPAMVVTLVPAPDARQSSSAAAGGTLMPLFAKYRDATEGRPVPVSTSSHRGDFSEMVSRLGDHQGRAMAGETTASDGAAAPPSSQRAYELKARVATAGKASPNTSTGQIATGAASTGELWGRIEPCWRDMGLKTGRPVTLEIQLGAAASLARPPQVIRPSEALLDEQRLRAEARALAAVAACLPRGDLRFANQTYRLVFGS